MRAERRWPMAAAVLTAAFVQCILPSRGRVPMWWLFPIFEVILLAVVMVQDPGRIDERNETARRLTFALIAVMTAGAMVGTAVLLTEIIRGRQAGLTASVLLGRGAGLWVTNVIVFSLWYWELDRGGAAERAARSGLPVSFAFPEDAMPELAADGWTPHYPDYLYLAFTTATAFSPTDTLPVKTWAKMMMLVQSVISLLLAILVVARAINILPG